MSELGHSEVSQRAGKLPAVRNVRFGPFEADLRAGELRKHGLRLRLTGQPMEVLALLLERPGEVVTREELRTRLWGGDTNVDFEHGLNAAVQKLREALADSAEEPRYIETLPRRGYRFIAAVEKEAAPGADQAGELLGPQSLSRKWGWVAAAAAATVALLGLVAGLRWNNPGAAAPRAARVTLAVLPFENLSGKPGQEHVSDGFTEDMITELGRLHPERLDVVARTSVMQYKGTKKTIQQIARELGVDYVLEGSVRREGERVRVTAQLIRAADQTHVWAERYDRELRDVLAVQAALAEAIAGQIRLQLTGEQRAFLARPRRFDSAAQEAYLKGRFYLSLVQEGSVRKAHDQFRLALEKDPNHAPAHAGLARCYLLGTFMDLPPEKSIPLARAEAQRAVALDDSLSEAHLALASVLLHHDWDWAGAEREIRRALELNRNDAEAQQQWATYLTVRGRFDEALAAQREAVRLDPLSVDAHLFLGRVFLFARRYDEALRQLENALARDRNNRWVHFFRAVGFEQVGKYDEFVGELLQFLEKSPYADNLDLAKRIRERYPREGHTGVLREWAREWEPDARKGLIQAYSMALLYGRLGEKDQAFAWLERALRERSRAVVYLHVEPQLDPLREDPRWRGILRRTGFPE